MYPITLHFFFRPIQWLIFFIDVPRKICSHCDGVITVSMETHHLTPSEDNRRRKEGISTDEILVSCQPFLTNALNFMDDLPRRKLDVKRTTKSLSVVCNGTLGHGDPRPYHRPLSLRWTSSRLVPWNYCPKQDPGRSTTLPRSFMYGSRESKHRNSVRRTVEERKGASWVRVESPDDANVVTTVLPPVNHVSFKKRGSLLPASGGLVKRLPSFVLKGHRTRLVGVGLYFLWSLAGCRRTRSLLARSSGVVNKYLD